MGKAKGKGRGRPRNPSAATGTAMEGTISIDISIPPVDTNSNNVEAMNVEANSNNVEAMNVEGNSNNVEVNVETTGEPESNGSKSEKNTSQATKSPVRRSRRIEQNKGSAVRINLAQGKKATAGPQVSSLPSPVQEVAHEPSSKDIEISNDETIQSLKLQAKENSRRNKGKQESAAQKKKALKGPDAGTLPTVAEIDSEKEAPSSSSPKHLETGAPEETIPPSTRQSARTKRRPEAFVPSNPVVQKTQASSKRQKVSAPRSSAEEEVPVNEPNAVQAVVERNLVTKDNTGPAVSATPLGSYQSMCQATEKRMEELMAGNIELTNQLHFERGKVEAYERMLNVVVPLRSIPPTTAAAAAASPPERENSPRATQDAPVVPQAAPSTKKRKYTKKK